MCSDKTIHAISSSDDESVKVISTKPDKNVSVLQTELLREILSKEEVIKYDINKLKNANTLFDEDITSDDEIWLVQCPSREINRDALQTASIDFDSSSSKLKLKVNKKKKRYNVYTIKNTCHHINFVLPSKKTSCFSLKSFPLSGKIVLQENVPIPKNADYSLNLHNESEMNNSTIINPEITDESRSADVTETSEFAETDKVEELENSFKKKKKKKRKDLSY